MSAGAGTHFDSTIDCAAIKGDGSTGRRLDAARGFKTKRHLGNDCHSSLFSISLGKSIGCGLMHGDGRRGDGHRAFSCCIKKSTGVGLP